jgi:ABC-2 type transport system ATP-binding protein
VRLLKLLLLAIYDAESLYVWYCLDQTSGCVRLLLHTASKKGGMVLALIEVEQLQKVFRVPVRRAGRFGALRTLLSREYRDVHAVEGVSFSIPAGQLVGYLGPNGAGKSTTLKMLTGILVPSAGRIEVAHRVPHVQRTEHARAIGVVFGQRTQLWWDLPTIESFELLRHIYRVPEQRWRSNLKSFIELLDLGPFLDTPVRQLSLGQRMRADLAAALLHDPLIVFLDEPTIGLDVIARERIRGFLLQLQRERGVTVILTTHDLGDVERLCQRVILIDQGRVIYDGALEALRARLGRWRTLVVDLDGVPPEPLAIEHATIVRTEGPRAWLRFDRDQISAAALIAAVAAHYPIRDLTVEEPEIESIVHSIYSHGIGEPQSIE